MRRVARERDMPEFAFAEASCRVTRTLLAVRCVLREA